MFDLPPPDPGIEISVASRGMSKGIAQTEGPQLVAKTFVHTGIVQTGLQWKNVTSPVAGGEGAAFVTLAPKLGKLQLHLGAAYKFQTGVTEPTDDKSWEFTGSLTRKFGKVSLRLATIYSPDDLGSSRRSLVMEAGPTLELGKSTKLSAVIGRRERVNGDDYTLFNAGVSHSIVKGVSVEARLYGTNRNDLGENYRERLVVSGKLAF